MRNAIQKRIAELEHQRDCYGLKIRDLEERIRQLKPMTYERASHINHAMLAVSYARMGLELEPGKPLPSLEEFKLAEMIECANVVRAKEDEEANTLPEGAAHSLTMVCDDRLVAALYVATHYDGTPEDSGNFEPLAEVAGKALILVELAGKRCEECGGRITPERAKTGTCLCGRCAMEAHCRDTEEDATI